MPQKSITKKGENSHEEKKPECEWVLASWYGPGFNLKRRADGGIFNMNQISVAHKYFPFGTKLRLTNPENNKSIQVEVNDRGPYVKGRDLDLSKGAARKLGFLKQGVALFKMEKIS